MFAGILANYRCYYELLGVDQSADLGTLRKAFRRLSKTLHPDTTALPVEQAGQQFQLLHEAYEVLSDPEQREAYDLTLLKKVSKSPLAPTEQLINPPSSQRVSKIGVLRPFSGGELFSLVLLSLAILFSLLLGLLVAFAQDRELQVRPTWLIDDQTITQEVSFPLMNDEIAASRDPFEPSLIVRP